MISACYRDFGFDARIHLSTRPAKAQGSAEVWERAQALLRGALEQEGIAYRISEGEGAFYAPKIDFLVLDALQREHQLGTIQVDYTLPERFDLKFSSAEGGEGRPVMIHRAMLGSLERFIGILVEHFAGAFPVWLSPVQAIVLPITDRVNDAAASVRASLRGDGFRVELDARNEKIGAKIRDAQMNKIPFMLVMGDREAQAGSVSVRTRSEGDRGAMPLDGFRSMLADLVKTRALKP
jgi:threonyl-tRNA synthetase